MEIADIPGTDLKIYIDRRGFNYGADQILLSSFAKMKKGSSLIDVGCGSGILAFRCKALYDLSEVTGIEIQDEPARRAKASAALNGICVDIVKKDMRDCIGDFREIDYIISNPPYLKKGEALPKKTEEHRISRQEITMTPEDLFYFSKKSLRTAGYLYMIHRPHRLPELIIKGKKYGFALKRLRTVHSRKDSPASAVLLAFRKDAGEHLTIERPLILYEGSEYTEEVLSIYEGR